MQYSEFIGQVQHRARLATEQDAIRATRATLETLAERLFGNEAEHLASQLPQEIGDILRSVIVKDKFNADEFFQRVCDREGEDLPQSSFHACVVIEILREAVSEGEFNHLYAQLPEEFHQILEASSTEDYSKR